MPSERGLLDLRTSGTSQDHVRVFAGGSDRGDGTTVADTGTLVDDLLRHFFGRTAEGKAISNGEPSEDEVRVPLGYLSRKILGATGAGRVLMNAYKSFEQSLDCDRNPHNSHKDVSRGSHGGFWQKKSAQGNE